MAGKPKLKSKTKAKTTTDSSEASANKSIMESAQQIWLAGLGALTKAREDGTKLFENLVKEGLSLEAATRKIATGKVDEVRGAVETGVSQVRERTQETWDRLEQVFESRVSRALNKLGVPGRKELDELLKRVDELNRHVVNLNPAAKKVGLAETLTNKVKRARDDFGDLVKDIEEAQLAAKHTVQRSVARLADAVTPAKPVAKAAAKKTAKPAAKKPAKKVTKKK